MAAMGRNEPTQEAGKCPMTDKCEIVPREAAPATAPGQLAPETGKAISRRNALRHGLTANPAVLPIEDATKYYNLLQDLTTAIQPRGPLEASLVDRIATSLFRLNRTVEVERSVAARQVAAVPPAPNETASLIERFYRCWEWRDVEERDKAKLKKAYKAGHAHRDVPWMRARRDGLDGLKGLLQKMRETSDGATALLEILRELERECRLDPHGVPAETLEQLAAVLGDPASSFPRGLEEAESGKPLRGLGEPAARRGMKWELLQGFRKWDTSKPLPPAIDSVLRACKRTLRTQMQALVDEYQQAWHASMTTAALIPDEAELAKLTRYETQAERSLFRSLHALAQLRGITLAELGAVMRSAVPPSGDSADSTEFG